MLKYVQVYMTSADVYEALNRYLVAEGVIKSTTRVTGNSITSFDKDRKQVVLQFPLHAVNSSCDVNPFEPEENP